MQFGQVVGVDQTGAVVASGPRKGEFQPLYVARIELDRSLTTRRLVLKTERSSLSELIEQALALDARTWITIDAVLGLPRSVQLPGETLWDWVDLARVAKPGRAGAEIFFEDLLRARGIARAPGAPLLRRCEQLARAQSLFSPRPYQRNVQTGTLRVWKELAGLASVVRKQLGIWPWVDERGSPPVAPKVILAEGYPRLWRGRAEPRLPGALDPNFRDAQQLALSTWALLSLEAGSKTRATSSLLNVDEPGEGWILGMGEQPSRRHYSDDSIFDF